MVRRERSISRFIVEERGDVDISKRSLEERVTERLIWVLRRHVPTLRFVHGEAERRAASALVEGGQRRADGIAECVDSAQRGGWTRPSGRNINEVL